MCCLYYWGMYVGLYHAPLTHIHYTPVYHLSLYYDSELILSCIIEGGHLPPAEPTPIIQAACRA